MSLWKVASERGNQIARELNLRKSLELVHPQQRRTFGKALAEMARTPEAPARARIEALYRQVPRRRELQTAAALLDLAWRIPPESRLEDDVVWMIRRCYLDAPREQWRLSIRDELRDRQVHPFPNVRRVVRLVRQVDAVDEAEISELANLERGYPDLRQSIAERVILLNQVDHLEPVIAYLCNALQGQGHDPEEERAAKRLFSTMASGFRKDERTLAILYREYLARYDSKEPRGFLMLALACYGDAIVPQLALDHTAHPGSRGPIEHVLAQIAMRGGVAATQQLLTILRDAHSQDVPRIAKLLAKALATLAGHGEHARGAAGVREAVVQSIPVLQRRPLREIRAFLSEFESLEWGQANIEILVESVLDGSVTDAERQQLRRVARPACQRLIAIAGDVERPVIERGRALEAIALLRGAATRELGSKLWSVFTAADLDEVRLGVLRALGALELDPGPQARNCLFGLIGTASPRLAEEIRLVWSRIFRAASLADTSMRDGIRT
ncbi:MAG: hypothetical protein WAK53_17730 [Chromatiaceae bacterium]|jgi:hypothetical protein